MQQMSPSRQNTALVADSPMLVLSLQRNGTLLGHFGGRQMEGLLPPANAMGRRIEELWPEAIARVLSQLSRKAISSRSTVDATFCFDNVDYEARATPTGPDRVNCVIRPAADNGSEGYGASEALTGWNS